MALEIEKIKGSENEERGGAKSLSLNLSGIPVASIKKLAGSF
jgi:hypothetical protein